MRQDLRNFCGLNRIVAGLVVRHRVFMRAHRIQTVQIEIQKGLGRQQQVAFQIHWQANPLTQFRTRLTEPVEAAFEYLANLCIARLSQIVQDDRQRIEVEQQVVLVVRVLVVNDYELFVECLARRLATYNVLDE
jgi:hypothetical protein